MLDLQQVIVVGHTECGGAKACLTATQRENFSPLPPIVTITDLPAENPLNLWLAPLTKFVSTLNAPTLPQVVEANIKHQVDNLCKTHVIVNAWTKGTPKKQEVRVHGWEYNLATGRLRDLNISRGRPL